MNKRISGIDLAKAFSIFGMMVVNYHFGFGAFQGNHLLHEMANFFSGRASATFVILAGIGMILFARRMRENPDDLELASETKNIIWIRSLLLFLIGTLDSIYWPADILRSYGIFFFIGSFFMNRGRNFYFLSSLLSIIAFTFLYLSFDFGKDWIIATFTYKGFWTPPGFLKSLFFNGWNPVLPWIGFFFWGMFLGTYLLEEKKESKVILTASIVSFILLFVLSLNTGFTDLVNPPVMKKVFGFESIFRVNQLPPLALYYFLSISFANIVILFFLRIGEKFEDSSIVKIFSKVGTYSHTIYLFHIYIGMIIYLWIRNINTEELFYSVYGKENIEFMWIFTLIAFSLLSLFVIIWNQFFKFGPLEFIVKKVSEFKLQKKEV